MPDVTVTLTEAERWALDSIAVMTVERRPLPAHWTEDGTLFASLRSAIAKLRGASTAPPSPIRKEPQP